MRSSVSLRGLGMDRFMGAHMNDVLDFTETNPAYRDNAMVASQDRLPLLSEMPARTGLAFSLGSGSTREK